MASALVQGASRGIGRAMVKDLVARGTFTTVYAACRDPGDVQGLGSERVTVKPIRIDLTDNESMRAAAADVMEGEDPLALVINAAGLLHDASTGMAPERKLEDLEPEAIRRCFEVNAFGPMLMARHFAPILVKSGQNAVFASISARVGSIGDNVMGGWYSYRAAKAAQNMLTKNLSIELKRRSRGKVAAIGLHPGTVRTDLSAPFSKNVKPEMLFEADQAASMLLDVTFSARDDPAGMTGKVYDYAGEVIEW